MNCSLLIEHCGEAIIWCYGYQTCHLSYGLLSAQRMDWGFIMMLCINAGLMMANGIVHDGHVTTMLLLRCSAHLYTASKGQLKLAWDGPIGVTESFTSL